MEDMMVPLPQYSSNPNPAPSSSNNLALHETSHVISKFKPKIRIIHIFAPEIIKTDVANFRELVQRLTGKPEANMRKKKKKKKKKITASIIGGNANNNKTMQVQHQWRSLELADGSEKIIKEEENETWGSFFDLDSFIQELSDSSYPAPMKSFPMDACA